ncbi:hypothetical protein NIES2107_60120 [Nostoc carneum NIES-2107]|nr:hypothetical protein NIES2107_60120 [Nostoc carneum NIES-2107]
MLLIKQLQNKGQQKQQNHEYSDENIVTAEDHKVFVIVLMSFYVIHDLFNTTMATI